MEIVRWIKSRLSHKLEHVKKERLLSLAKKEGVSLVVIIIIWEIIEDILFPILFGFLGKNVHGSFYVALPISWLLCVHWLTVPIIWSLWRKIRGLPRSAETHELSCKDHEHVHSKE